MYFAVSLLAIIAIVALSVWLGPSYPGREYVRLFGYLMVSITTWRLFFTLRHIQKQGIKSVKDIGLSQHPVSEETKGSLLSRLWEKRRNRGDEDPPESTNTESHKENTP